MSRMYATAYTAAATETMSHQPTECEHLWTSWNYEPERAEGGVLIRRLMRRCFLCNQLEGYGEAPRDEP